MGINKGYKNLGMLGLRSLPTLVIVPNITVVLKRYKRMRMEIRRQIGPFASHLSRSFEVLGTDTDR